MNSNTHRSFPHLAVSCGSSVGHVYTEWETIRQFSSNLDVALGEGHGRHIYIWGPVEGPEKLRRWRKILYAFELVFHTSTTLAKYSMSVPPGLSAKLVQRRAADIYAYGDVACCSITAYSRFLHSDVFLSG